MGHKEPLGLHDAALKHLLQARGVEQLHSARRFGLCQIALYRLQARQLLLGEDITVWQQTLLDSLNLERPDLQIMYHVSRVIRLCHRSDQLIWHIREEEDSTREMPEILRLLQDIEELTTSIETWTSSLDYRIKPMRLTPELDLSLRLGRITTANEEPLIDAFDCPNLLLHHDIAIGDILSFYAAAQMILRDNTVQVLRHAASGSMDTAQQFLDRIPGEELAIDGLSSSIIRSFPALMGFDVSTSTGQKPRKGHSQAESLGRFLGVFAMLVVKKNEATSATHKHCAESVLSWMHSHYQIA